MMLPVFESRMGAMLFLISALLSRGLVCLLFYSFVCVISLSGYVVPEPSKLSVSFMFP